MITLDALQVLDAIDRHGSFAAAANALHRVPSALSYTVRQLEDGLGVALFDRSGQRARLTATGRMVLEQGRELLAAADRLSLRARQSASGWEPRVRLVVEAVLPMQPLMPLVQQFATEQPLIELELREEALNGSWEALQEQRADLLIGVGRDAPAGMSVEFAALGDLSFQLVCAAHHPLALHEPGQLTADDLKNHTQVVLRDSARQMQALSVGLFETQRRLQVNHYGAKKMAIMAGVGFGHLAGRDVADAVERGQLVALSHIKPAYKVPMFMAWHKHRAGEGTRWWRKQIKASGCFDVALG
ncbi:LysR substrate-binding domain-containing protein [Simiduia agarivorans]|uniref:LysR family transcriptional regulator n=1 Tax=Simiduia agarivorans (strain DSM 21679 / JCM 13881 / BCRC 17597 / SA1) TaxID=1117647 RepID=K4KNK1_SIMAS|nr:LysR substrate-binding domain-containing protein [Simiduia agarivorans]AFV00740.1 LysR family transcriptional regulator [Simiduia agarivorans SA1 = DSM 21679]